MGISLEQMDEVFRADKGWTRYENQGWEYVYEYCVPNSVIRIKVGSGIAVAGAVNRCKPIRMFAIGYEKTPKKNVWGLCKSVSIKPTEGWKDRVKQRYTEVLNVARHNLAATGKK